MALALELGLGMEADGAVRELWSALEADGVPSLASHLPGIRPHLTLVVSEDADRLRGCAARLRELVSEQPVTLTGPGLFPGPRPVLYLAAAATAELLALHAAVCELAEAAGVGIWPHYRPGTWLPHCTLSMAVPEQGLEPALRRCLSAALPIAARLGDPALTDSVSGETAPL